MVIEMPDSMFKFNKNFVFYKLVSISNFDKCIDYTSKKHYLNWNPVKTSKPDFYSHEYFEI
tara:strand:+ start:417 stop:599 length:183 start_codon:yes stop_codon:yes gene_type:complete